MVRRAALLLAWAACCACSGSGGGTLSVSAPPPGWAEELLAERAQKDRQFREADDTPLPAEDLPGFRGLAYWPPDPRWRFAGLASNASLTARAWTKPFFLASPGLRVDAAIAPGGELRVELCGALGQPLKGFSFADAVPLGGDSAAHVPRWKGGALDDHRLHPVSMRMEWTRGVVYGAAVDAGGAV